MKNLQGGGLTSVELASVKVNVTLLIYQPIILVSSEVSQRDKDNTKWHKCIATRSILHVYSGVWQTCQPARHFHFGQLAQVLFPWMYLAPYQLDLSVINRAKTDEQSWGNKTSEEYFSFRRTINLGQHKYVFQTVRSQFDRLLLTKKKPSPQLLPNCKDLCNQLHECYQCRHSLEVILGFNRKGLHPVSQ